MGGLNTDTVNALNMPYLWCLFLVKNLPEIVLFYRISIASQWVSSVEHFFLLSLNSLPFNPLVFLPRI